MTNNRDIHNPSGLYFSNEDFDTIIDIVETGIEKDGTSLITFDEKQRDTLLDLFQNGTHKKQIFDFGVELLQMKNYQNEYNINDNFLQKCIKNIQEQLDNIFNDEIIQKEMQGITSRNHKVKAYYNIEFAKGRFAFHTLHNMFNEDLPGFRKSLTRNNTIGLFPNNEVNELLFSGKDEGKFLEDYICKINLAYEELKTDIDVFTRFTTTSGIHGIPSIANWREFYLATALYQNLYSHIKEVQATLEGSHEEGSQSNIDSIGYSGRNNSIEDIIDIRQESFLDGLITQIKQAYMLGDRDMIKELNQSLDRMGKEKNRKSLVGDLKSLCAMYSRLKGHIDTMKANYGNNAYYTVVTIEGDHQETKQVDDPWMQDMLWFFFHNKFIIRRDFWNGIAKKAFTLQQLENNFYIYLHKLGLSDE